MAVQRSVPAQAAAMIRQYMRANGIVGKVRSKSYSMGSSVNVNVQDLPPQQYQALNEYANQFQYGSFNGMIDLYEYDNRNDSLPQVKFVFVNNSISNEMDQVIWNFMLGYYAGMENAPQSAVAGGSFYNERFGAYGQDLAFRLFRGVSSNAFWDFYQDQKMAA